MKNHLLLIFSSAALLVATNAPGLRAQDSSQVAYSSDATSAKAAKAAAAKPHKVWTEDDLGTVRTVADKYKDQKAADAEATAGAANQPKTNKPAQRVGGRSLLSNPKSPEEADHMIAWEDRDLDAQTELVDKVRTELREAPSQDRDRLEKLLAKRIEVVEEIKREREALLAQKKELEKKPAPAPSSDSAEQDAPARQ